MVGIFFFLFKLLSLSLALSSLLMQCLSVDFFVYIVFRIHWASWVYKLQFFTRFRKCSYIIYSSIFFLPLSLPLLSSLKSNYTYITILDVVKKTSEACSEDFSSMRPLSVPWARYCLSIHLPVNRCFCRLASAEHVSTSTDFFFISVLVLSALEFPCGFFF